MHLRTVSSAERSQWSSGAGVPPAIVAPAFSAGVSETPAELSAPTAVSDLSSQWDLQEEPATNSSPNSVFAAESNPTLTVDIEAAIVRKLEGQGWLQRKSPPSDNYFVRGTSALFEPSVMHVGKAAVSCPVVTAIKKKNPLRLFNPFVNDFGSECKILVVRW